LAGLPDGVIQRAENVLANLTSGAPAKKLKNMNADLPLFTAQETSPALVTQSPSQTEEALKNIDPDALTPREALNALYALKQTLKNGH
jgi:DNA mismatch repair protein MutS